jgi:hypothetical protein
MARLDVLRQILLRRHAGELSDDAYRAAVADFLPPAPAVEPRPARRPDLRVVPPVD